MYSEHGELCYGSWNTVTEDNPKECHIGKYIIDLVDWIDGEEVAVISNKKMCLSSILVASLIKSEKFISLTDISVENFDFYPVDSIFATKSFDCIYSDEPNNKYDWFFISSHLSYKQGNTEQNKEFKLTDINGVQFVTHKEIPGYTSTIIAIAVNPSIWTRGLTVYEEEKIVGFIFRH